MQRRPVQAPGRSSSGEGEALSMPTVRPQYLMVYQVQLMIYSGRSPMAFVQAPVIM